MKFSSILIICSLLFITCSSSISNSTAYVIFNPSLETDKETYYPFDIIKINASWSLMMEENEYINIYIFFLDINNNDLINPIECPVQEGYTSYYTEINYSSLSINCSYNSIVKIILNFQLDNIDFANYENYITLQKFNTHFENSQNELVIINPNPIRWESRIFAQQNPFINYTSSSVNISISKEHQIIRILNVSISDGSIFFKYESIDLNDMGNFTVSINLVETPQFYSKILNISLHIIPNLTNFNSTENKEINTTENNTTENEEIDTINNRKNSLSLLSLGLLVPVIGLVYDRFKILVLKKKIFALNNLSF